MMSITEYVVLHLLEWYAAVQMQAERSRNLLRFLLLLQSADDIGQCKWFEVLSLKRAGEGFVAR